MLLGKSMNSNLLPSAMGKVKQTGFFNLGMTTSLEEKTEFKPAVLYLKIDLVSHSAYGKGFE